MGKLWGARTTLILILGGLCSAVACTAGPEVSTSAGSNDSRPAAYAVSDVGDPAAGSREAESPPPADVTSSSKPPAATTSSTTSTTSTVPDEDAESPDDPGDDDEAGDTSSTTEADPGNGGGSGSGTSEGESYAAASVAYVNARRAENALGSLSVDPELTAVAHGWAERMVAEQDLYHNPDLGAQVPSRYRTWGENIAYSSDPTGIDGMWWGSDGHRANMLGSGYTHIGVAFVQDSQGTWWAVQNFGG